MRKARCEVIDPDEVNVVHVCSRTVRRCFLLGDDVLSGKNFDHRKGWIEDILRHFAGQFGIDLLTYSVLSNHFHLILRNRPDVVATWDDTEVARRWSMICPHRKDGDGNPLPPTQAELDVIRRCPVKLKQSRERLADVSWWMRLLCQSIAMRSNREDNASGRFFEERFRAVRLVDEASVLACSAYVDLNPIRAAMCETIETSDHTSVKCRIEALRQRNSEARQSAADHRTIADPSCKAAGPPAVIPLRSLGDAFLSPLLIDELTGKTGADASLDPARCSDKGFLPLSVLDYIELLDWTARHAKPGKRGATPEQLPPVVARLGIEAESWCELVNGFGRLFHHVAGCPATIDALRSHETSRRFRVHPRVRVLMPVAG
jgi:hypothetical protein